MTVYDRCHLGNARIWIFFDVVVRYLRYLGYNVKYVRNITDIDDKIINRARELHEDYTTVIERFNALIFMEEALRKNKHWQVADEIRQQLERQGVVLEDTAQGTVWKKK